MSSDTGFEKYIMLRFTSKEDLRKFREKVTSPDLVSVSDTPQEDKKSNKEDTDEGSMWTKLGASQYDDKPVEHPPRGKGSESNW